MITNHPIRTWAGTLVAGAGLGLAALAFAGTAAAASSDHDFLDEISSQGIGFDSPQGAIQDAHLVCRQLAAGRTGVAVGQQILSQTNLNTRQVAYFVVDAVETYCPQLSPQLSA